MLKILIKKKTKNYTINQQNYLKTHSCKTLKINRICFAKQARFKLSSRILFLEESNPWSINSEGKHSDVAYLKRYFLKYYSTRAWKIGIYFYVRKKNCVRKSMAQYS